MKSPNAAIVVDRLLSYSTRSSASIIVCSLITMASSGNMPRNTTNRPVFCANHTTIKIDKKEEKIFAEVPQLRTLCEMEWCRFYIGYLNHLKDYESTLFSFLFLNRKKMFVFQINLRLILVSGKTKEFLFSPSDSAGDIAQTVFDQWPEGEYLLLTTLLHNIFR